MGENDEQNQNNNNDEEDDGLNNKGENDGNGDNQGGKNPNNPDAIQEFFDWDRYLNEQARDGEDMSTSSSIAFDYMTEGACAVLTDEVMTEFMTPYIRIFRGSVTIGTDSSGASSITDSDDSDDSEWEETKPRHKKALQVILDQKDRTKRNRSTVSSNNDSPHKKYKSLPMYASLKTEEEKEEFEEKYESYDKLEKFIVYDFKDYQIPEYKLADMSDIPFEMTSKKEILETVAKKRKERDERFMWPIPTFEDLEKASEESDDDEFIDALGIKITEEDKMNDFKMYEGVKKRIMNQLEEESEYLLKQINKEADKIYNEYKDDQNVWGGDGLLPLSEEGKSPAQQQQDFYACHKRKLSYIEENKLLEERFPEMTDDKKKKLKENEKLLHEIAWLRYVCGHKVMVEKQIEGRNEVREEYTKPTFDGFVVGKNKVEHGILASWVQTWLSAIYYKVLMKKNNFWLHLPAGSVRLDEDKASEDLLSPIPMVYPQKNLNLCLLKSFCSVLHYLGFHGNAKDLDSQMDKYMNRPLNMAILQLKQYMKKQLP